MSVDWNDNMAAKTEIRERHIEIPTANLDFSAEKAIRDCYYSRYRKTKKYLYLWNYEKLDQNSNGKSGVFDYGEFEKKVCPGD